MTPTIVSDLMTASVTTTPSDASLSALAEIFDSLDVRHVPVVDGEGDLIGVVSDRDLLRNVLTDQVDVPLSVRHASMENTRVESIMTGDVITVEPNDSVQRAARLMLDNRFGCLPVTEGSRLVGIVCQSDFLAAVANDGA